MSTVVVLGLAQLAETASGEFTVDELLFELCTLAASALQVDGAGVMIAEDEGHLRFIHADPARVVDLENLQQVLQRGPCRTAMQDRAAVVVGDITESQQWPEFEDAARHAGLRGVVALPMLARGEAWGALDVYRNARSSWTTDEVSLIRLFAGVAASYLVMAADRDQARLAHDEMAHRATHDALTGLPGLELLFTMLAHALATARRHRSTVAVLFVDLHGFKAINDTLGHSAGDAALVMTAKRLASPLRANDFLARLAGDEFIVVCEGLPADHGAAAEEMRTLGRRLLASLLEPASINGTEVLLSASIGVALGTGDADSEQVLADADSAMYQAKKHEHEDLVISADPRRDARHGSA